MSLVPTLIVFAASLALLALPYRISGVKMATIDWLVAFTGSLTAVVIAAIYSGPLGLVEAARIVLWAALFNHGLLLAWHITARYPEDESNARRGTRAAGAALFFCFAALLFTAIGVG